VFNDSSFIIEGVEGQQLQDWEDHTQAEDAEFAHEFSNTVEDDRIPDADNLFTPNVFDNTFLGTEIALAQGAGLEEDVQYWKVIKRQQDVEGQPIGIAHVNLLLDTREFEVEFTNGHKEALSANLIAQHLYSQIDEEGN
jgi:hypothetical protein